jgi:hypothetical protein
MPTPIINGTVLPVRSSLDISYDPTRGRVVTENWESGGDNLRAIALECEENRIAYQLKASPLHSHIVLTATDERAGVGGVTVDSWQLLANELQNDVKMHPAILAAEAAEPGMIGHVVADVETVNQGEAVDLTYYESRTAASGLFELLKRGATHYAVSQYVLRHTANVSNLFLGMTADDGFEHIYTTSQLLTNVASGWTFNCPPRLRTKIQSVTDAIIDLNGSHSGYLWGWLKKGSTEVTAANNRIDISSEFWFSEWSTFLYPTFPVV